MWDMWVLHPSILLHGKSYKNKEPKHLTKCELAKAVLHICTIYIISEIANA